MATTATKTATAATAITAHPSPGHVATEPSAPAGAEGALGVEQVVGVEYFNAPYHHRPSAAPGLVLGVLGLGLILLGGCFMIGLLIMHQNTDTDWSGVSVYIYLVVLYVCAGACFAGAVTFLLLAMRSLLAVARG